MRNLLATTAIILATGTAAMADSHATATMDADMMHAQTEASDLIGQRLYVGDPDGMFSDWDDIGEINDLLVSIAGDGEVNNAVVGYGGFLGLGEKEVVIDLDRITQKTDEDGERFLVINATQAELEAMAEYTPADHDMEKADNADAMAAPALNDQFQAPTLNREGYEVTTVDVLTVEDLDGARIYDTNDEDIGEIKTLVLGDDGKITAARIDVGGFLGMGERQVEVDFNELTILRGDDLRVYIDATQEQLENRPQYNE